MFEYKRKIKRMEMELHAPSITNQTKLGMNIAKHLFSKEEEKEQDDKNIVFSPLSIYVALCTEAAGSDGLTRDEILSFLNSDSTYDLDVFGSYLANYVLFLGPGGSGRGDHDSHIRFSAYRLYYRGPLLHFVNALRIDQSYSLNASFKSHIHCYYQAAIASADFQTKTEEVRKEVNSLVKKETNDVIEDVLPLGSLDSSSKLVFANALNFKAEWEEKFEKIFTKDFDFHLLNNTSVKVPLMTDGLRRPKFVCAFDGFKVLRLPCKKGHDKRQFSMYIFLPDAKDGLSDLIEKAASEPGFLEHNLPQQKVEVSNFRIPKFNFSFEIDISKVLKEMGLALAFSEKDGNFSKMVDPNVNESPYISGIFQKSYIEVDEEGIEVEIIKIMGQREDGDPPNPTENAIDFVADHPFLFLIREDLTKTILFIGRVLNPLVT